MSVSSSCSGRSLLDRAIVVSIVAMAAMNVLVLVQQLQPEPTFAADTTRTAVAA